MASPSSVPRAPSSRRCGSSEGRASRIAERQGLALWSSGRLDTPIGVGVLVVAVVPVAVLGESRGRLLELELERENNGKDPASPDEGPSGVVHAPCLLLAVLAFFSTQGFLLRRPGLALLWAHDSLLSTK